MSRSARSLVLAACVLALGAAFLPAAEAIRPPAVPLITHDPYFSLWSAADRLTDDWPKHWTGRTQAMAAFIRIDGKPYRVMGPSPRRVPALAQAGLQVSPTRTVYTFRDAGIELGLTFLSPLLASDLDILSRPVSYVTFEARAVDGASHAVALYMDATAEIAVNDTTQSVVWSRLAVDGAEALAIGSKDQPVLAKRGDNLRIDWGYFYLAVPSGQGARTRLGSAVPSREAFLKDGRLPARDDMDMPRSVDEDYPAASVVFDCGRLDAAPVTRRVMAAYDDRFSIEYFYRKLRPYWRRAGMDAAGLLEAAAKDYPALAERCRRFDDEFMADLAAAGGPGYAALGALSYRQSLAAHKLAADIDGTPLFFPKENFSNGCISTVDVIYPEAPMYLLMSPPLMRALLAPVFDYAKAGEWKFPFAPHDLGTYPQANGQVYGGGARTEENQMPVEESGNLILLAAALAKVEGTPAFALKYWDQIRTWAEYLESQGPGSREPALHRRLRRPSGPQRQPVDQGHPGPAGLCRPVRAGREEGGGRGVYEARGGLRQRMGAHGRRRGPLPAGLRQARDLEPEIQPGLGQAPGIQPLSGRRGPQGDRLLYEKPASLRPAAGQPQGIHQARLDFVDGHAGRRAGGFRRPARPRFGLAEQNPRPRSSHRLVLDEHGQAGRIPGPSGRRGRPHQDAGRPGPGNEMGGPGIEMTRKERTMKQTLLLILAAVLVMAVGCSKSAKTEAKAGTFKDDLTFLQQHTRVAVLEDLGGTAQIAVNPDLQGRVMTSTAGGSDGLSFGWINRAALASTENNLHMNAFGGEDRFWLGPEGGQFSIFFKKGAPFNLDNWFTPPPINEGEFRVVSQQMSAVHFRKQMKLVNYSGTEFDLEVNRVVTVLEKPALATLGIELPAGVRAVAYSSDNTVTNTGLNAWTKETGLAVHLDPGHVQSLPGDDDRRSLQDGRRRSPGADRQRRLFRQGSGRPAHRRKRGPLFQGRRATSAARSGSPRGGPCRSPGATTRPTAF